MSYIQARLSTPPTAFAFSFTPSQNAEWGLPDIPVDFVVSASPDKNNFLPVAHLTEGMPSDISENYISPIIFTDGNTHYVRFQVLETIGKRENSHIFAMSEFQMHNIIFDEEASPYYLSEEVREAFDALQAEMQNIHSQIGAGTVTAADRTSLSAAIEAAEQALENATEIRTIPASSSKDRAIYNLNGQRVSKAQKGIYIVNGRKVLY